jgi:hypothetical protein
VITYIREPATQHIQYTSTDFQSCFIYLVNFFIKIQIMSCYSFKSDEEESIGASDVSRKHFLLKD